MVIVIDEQEVKDVPDNLEDFFESFPSIGRNNMELTGREHVNMWRDQVLFIRQRQQATSDFRENPNYVILRQSFSDKTKYPKKVTKNIAKEIEAGREKEAIKDDYNITH